MRTLRAMLITAGYITAALAPIIILAGLAANCNNGPAEKGYTTEELAAERARAQTAKTPRQLSDESAAAWAEMEAKRAAAPRPPAEVIQLGMPTVRWATVWTEALVKATNTTEEPVSCALQAVWEDGGQILHADDEFVTLRPRQSEVVKFHSAMDQRIPRSATLSLNVQRCRTVRR